MLAAPPLADLNWDSRAPDSATSSAPYRIYNIGNDRPEEINRLIAIIETALGRHALRVDVPCHLLTFWKPAPMSAIFAALSASHRRQHLKTECSGLSNGTGAFINQAFRLAATAGSVHAGVTLQARKETDQCAVGQATASTV